MTKQDLSFWEQIKDRYALKKKLRDYLGIFSIIPKTFVN